MKLTFKQRMAVYIIAGSIMTAISAAGTIFGIKNNKAKKENK